MARKEKQAAPAEGRFRWFRLSARVLVVGGTIAGGLFAFHKIENFLLRDPRFTVAMPDYGLESPSIHIEGVRYASRAHVLRVFAPDFGRSIYQVPLSVRREQLRQLDWVKDGSISRVWPNRLIVKIREREPVAFIQTAGQGGFARFALIDGDGVVLEQPKQGSFKLPVVLGLKPDAPITQRREGIHRMLRLVADLGSLNDRVSEVDVSDPDNLKVTSRVDSRAVVLMLGDHNFSVRLQNFINHYSQIQQRLPNAETLDLRLEDRITVVEGKS